MAYTYWFGNVGWFDEIPTVALGQNAGAVWKTPGNPRPSAGLNYIFNNSFFLRSKYIKKKRLRSVRHFNNAIQYCRPGDGLGAACDGPAGFFGDHLSPSDEDRFTKDWSDLNIRFQNDVVSHKEYPAVLIEAGYRIENGLSAEPGFADPASGDFRLAAAAPARGRGIAARIDLESGERWDLPAGLNLGAWQDGGPITPPAMAFGLHQP